MEYKKYSLAVGTVLKNGKYDYKITDILSSGSFGITYKVSVALSIENILTTVSFAVKELFLKGCYRAEDGCTVLCPESLESEFKANLKAFFNEAQLLHSLSHLSKNIIHVNEVFECFGTAYYVMEYIEGGNLEEWVTANGPLDENAALNMINKVCDAVEFIHSNNLLHLDIKPSNIMLKHNPEDNKVYPTLVDFGLAKQFDTNGKPYTSVIPKGATDCYAPKEQYADITHFNPAIDVYSLAGTLLFILTGNNPKSAFDIKPQDIIKELGSKTSINTRNAILKAMNPDSDSRTQTARAFRAALMNVADSQIDDNTTLKKDTSVFENRKKYDKRSNHKKKIIIFATSIVVIALACVLLWTNSKEKKDDTTNQNNLIVETSSDSTEVAPDVKNDSLSTNSKVIDEPSVQTQAETHQANMPSDMTIKQESNKNEKLTSPAKADKQKSGNKDKDKSQEPQDISKKSHVTSVESSTNDVYSTKEDNVAMKTPADNNKVNAEESQRREEAEEVLRQHEINNLLK